ncbi:hypothetical protein [Leptospirillum ferriphilum]|uniref:hypothetical protein n=1 Tax=Leptospirillum ferriphilum TaxID=178606 RepID=UPI000B2251E0|nr:hypothetical protein [Leptospirillum ferriphilum]
MNRTVRDDSSVERSDLSFTRKVAMDADFLSDMKMAGNMDRSVLGIKGESMNRAFDDEWHVEVDAKVLMCVKRTFDCITTFCLDKVEIGMFPVLVDQHDFSVGMDELK